MPLPKPDKELVNKILRERQTGIRPEDIFSPIQDAALLAIGDGAITLARANNLARVLKTNPDLASVFPNHATAFSFITFMYCERPAPMRVSSASTSQVDCMPMKSSTLIQSRLSAMPNLQRK